MKNKKIVMITGATSGIGKASAKKFAENNYDIIITGRRNERLNELASKLKQEFNTDVLCLNFDVRNLKDVNKNLELLKGKWENIDVLVNNAGLSLSLKPIQSGLIEEWDQMIDTNVKGLLYVTRFIAPMMIARKKGHIINIGSIAGKDVYQNGNIYCATKFAVDALSRAMRIDMLPHGIKVTSLHPGAADTEFSLVRFGGDKQAADNVYKGWKPLVGEDVAELIYYVTSLPDHVNINDVVITATAQANSIYLNKEG